MDPSGAGTCAQIGADEWYTKSQGAPTAKPHDNPCSYPLRVPAEDIFTEPDCGLQSSNAGVHEQKAEEMVGKTKEQRGWRKVIRNFTPS